MSNVKQAMDTYLNGLRNQHAVETQAIGTIQNELPRMEAYPDLHAKMKADHERSVTQAARLDEHHVARRKRQALGQEPLDERTGRPAPATTGLSDSELKRSATGIL